jgi:hypothetical protein
MSWRLPAHLRVDTASASAQLTLFSTGRRIFAPYQEWEDYRAGMYSGRLSDAFVALSADVLASDEKCRPAMAHVVRSWPVATAVNLTNTAMNQRAWIGQAACCLAVGSSADETKRAWWQLAEDERVKANAYADEVIASCQSTRG